MGRAHTRAVIAALPKREPSARKKRTPKGAAKKQRKREQQGSGSRSEFRVKCCISLMCTPLERTPPCDYCRTTRYHVTYDDDPHPSRGFPQHLGCTGRRQLGKFEKDTCQSFEPVPGWDGPDRELGEVDAQTLDTRRRGRGRSQFSGDALVCVPRPAVAHRVIEAPLFMRFHSLRLSSGRRSADILACCMLC